MSIKSKDHTDKVCDDFAKGGMKNLTLSPKTTRATRFGAIAAIGLMASAVSIDDAQAKDINLKIGGFSTSINLKDLSRGRIGVSLDEIAGEKVRVRGRVDGKGRVSGSVSKDGHTVAGTGKVDKDGNVTGRGRANVKTKNGRISQDFER